MTDLLTAPSAHARIVAARSAGRRRLVVVTVVLSVLALVLLVLGVCLGRPVLSPGDVLATLFGSGDHTFLVNRRLPRAVVGALVGVALGLSGALLQTLARNPLASPDLLGITGGASAGAVTALLLLGWTGAAVSASAFVGAIVAALLIVLLAWRRGISGYRFVLVGIALAFMAQSLVSYLLSRSEVRDAQSALAWLVGSLAGTRMVDILPVAIGIAVLLPLVAIVAPRLQLLELGDDAARSLGVRPDPTRLAITGLLVALAAVAVAAAGPVAFVAFVAAPIARRLVRGGRLALPQAALVGACVVLAADLLAQYAIPGVRVPVGLVTAIVGAPYLLWLLAVSNRRGKGA